MKQIEPRLMSGSSILDYIDVLKPKETSLLIFISACTGIIAAGTLNGGFPVSNYLLLLAAITLGSAGANGLTNFLDRDVDARMGRTCNRALPSGRISPPQKALPLIILLIGGGLTLAWILYPRCFFIGVLGILASSLWRKTISCTFLGIIAGSTPVLISWYAIARYPGIDVYIILYFCLIAAWTPLHVWTLMLANRSDYEKAGLNYFPLSWKDKDVIRILAILSVVLYSISLSIYFLTGVFHWLYLIVSNIMGIFMMFASLRLLISPTSKNAWKVYKFSAFPYLGIIFMVMAIDIWIK